jgi:hypothetical protein
MDRRFAPKRPLRLNAFMPLMLLGGLCLVLACEDRAQAPEPPAPSGPESFTFFDIGRNSRFSESLRKALAQKLGNDAVERRSIIDLETNYNGFLATHLPELESINRRLNHPPGERVDHDVIKLMYRYARQKNTPFNYVELIFDGQYRSPLVFRIRFKVDETGMVEALHAKHGTPLAVAWEREGGQSLVWRKEQDVLMVSLVPDAFGGVDHHITIYFTENLSRWVEFEQALKQQESKEASPGKTAF